MNTLFSWDGFGGSILRWLFESKKLVCRPAHCLGEAGKGRDSDI